MFLSTDYLYNYKVKIMRLTESGAKPIGKEVRSVKLLHGSCSKEQIRESLRKRSKPKNN